MEQDNLIKESAFYEINQIYDECLTYLENYQRVPKELEPNKNEIIRNNNVKSISNPNVSLDDTNVGFKVINELKSNETINSLPGDNRSGRLRRLSQQLPKILITDSNTSLNRTSRLDVNTSKKTGLTKKHNYSRHEYRRRVDFPKRLVTKCGVENVALISNVPFEKIRLLNDTFHTLINLRWRWIVIGTVVIHFAIWLVFAVFWYITALAHYDFEPEPPQRLCVTGGKDFVTIFLASVEAQEGEVIRYFAQSLKLEQRQFLLWPVTLTHVIDCTSPLYHHTPQDLADDSYEITVSLKGASASMGTFTQSQTSYLPTEIVWGHRFPSVVRYDTNKQKYVIEYDKLSCIEPVDTPYCSSYQLHSSSGSPQEKERPGTPGSFSERVSTFKVKRYINMANNNYESERRGSRNRALERSLSYSEAIGNGSARSSIEIPRIANTEVYTNEELKKHYRISQTYVEGKEIVFPNIVTNVDTTVPMDFGDASTRPLVSSSSPNDTYESIEPDREGIYNEAPSSVFEYSTPYSKRRRAAKRCRRQHGRPMRSRRVVHKSGEENVPVRSNIPSKSMKYMRDIVNTVINSKWRYMILLIMFSHFVFWLLFASIWYVVSASYQEDIGDGKEHCITGTSSFAGMLMMAVETQMTIGYGVRYPNEECPEAIVIMVCLRDGELCLQFRVWDFLSTHLIGSTINAYLHKPIRTLEGELVPNYIQQLKLCQARALLLWPITVVHVIDAESPLFHMSAEDMMDYRFEIVVCLTGASKSLGTTTQSRTSYLSKEIIWGYRFKNVLKYCKKAEAYTIDVDNLNTVEQVETPLCSASRLKEFEEDMRSEQLLSTIDLSTSPTNLSLSQDETLSRVGESVPSTPVLNRTGTQRSYGWSFKRFYPERFQRSRDVGKQMQELEK
ncbi:unnamed protein product [Leptidea sinapis]|uniref:Inward rectifier potassium channel C-terminal domain-containing protein n=1 Tax=Leptidea sinapis TaxID=189913 RepID=A0A5E4Q5S4_9NEOP|nr:unnamed protein product [Leptidea sinapis]